MRVLLDTHVVIWALEGGGRLSQTARQLVEDERHEVLVSAVSAWEMAIKSALGRLEVRDDLEAAVEEAGFLRVPLGFAEARRVGGLPSLHQDPFDRMLIAQALERGIPIVSSDTQIARYPLQVIW